jgi:hypothetical protein
MSIGKLNDFVYDFLRTSEKGNLMGMAAYGSPKGLLDGLVDLERMTMRMDLLAQTAPFPEVFRRRAGEPRRGAASGDAHRGAGRRATAPRRHHALQGRRVPRRHAVGERVHRPRRPRRGPGGSARRAAPAVPTPAPVGAPRRARRPAGRHGPG